MHAKLSEAAAPGLRTKISPGRVTGRVLEWKNNFGWIQPDKTIHHPQAAKRQGRIYLSRSDVEAPIEGVGAVVSFFVYADGTGLGAMGCRPAGSYGAIRASTTGARQPVSGMPMTGVVRSWSGDVGWIVPCQVVQHALFRGKIYVHVSDVEQRTELPLGTKVAFSMYADPQGLGAERCVVVDGGMAAGGTWAPEAATPSGPHAKLLEATPKAGCWVPPGAVPPPARGPRDTMDPEVVRAADALRADPGLASSRVAQDPDMARRLAAWMLNIGD